jgi:hypothetical protein
VRTSRLKRRLDELERELGRYRLGWLPGHFYSPIPNLDEIRQREAQIYAISPEAPGVDLNVAVQFALLHELAPFHAEQPFRTDRQPGLRYFFDNPNFATGDAVAYYSLLRHLRPRRVVEVGSGYSSCLLLDTVDRFLGGTVDCTFIEPDAALLLSLIGEHDQSRIELVELPVQDVSLSVFEQLENRDVLFVDSSHVAKVGSDVNHLFFHVLPKLAPGVVVHLHDIQYPFEYPKEWIYEGRAWNEAYVARTFLQFNDRFEILLYPSYLARFHRDALELALPLCAAAPGSSLWLRRKA